MFAVVQYTKSIAPYIAHGGEELNATAKVDILGLRLFDTYADACAWVDSPEGRFACAGRWHDIVNVYDTVDGCKDETRGEQ